MEIGHNVMHGQYDWMRDPALNSKMFEWDTACPADQWRHSHNYMHHTYTNILDKDRDIGYGILRMDETQKWNPYYLGNPVYAFLLMTFFQYGVDAARPRGREPHQPARRKWSDNKELREGIWRKVGRQTLKDYVLFPALTGPLFLSTLDRATPRPTWSATSGRTRSSSAGTSRPASPRSPRRRPRTRPAGSGTSGR